MFISRSSLCAALVAMTAGSLGLVPLAQATPPAVVIPSADDSVGAHEAWARASAGEASTGAAYVTLTGGAQLDQLIAASTPVAATAEVHETINDNGITKMRRVPSLAIPPGQTVALAPGGRHIMLTGLKQKLVAGQSFPLTLTFAHAAPITVKVSIRGMGAAAGSSMDDHMGGSMNGHEHMQMH